MADIYQLTPVKPFKARQVATPDQMGVHASLYLQRLAAMGKAASTVAAYQTDLEQFVGFMQGRRLHYVTGVTLPDVDAFVLHCLQVRGNSGRTTARKLEAIKGFFKWAMREKLIALNPAAEAEAPKFVPGRVIAPEMDELLAFLDRIPTDTALGLRDRAFYELMLYSAGRISALTALNVYDPNAALNTISPHGRMVYTLKGGAVEEKALNNETLEWVNRWLAVRDALAGPDEVALFVSLQRGRVTRAGMHNRLKEYGRRFGLPGIHPHLFRHRRVGQILDTLGVRAAQEYANHKNPNTTLATYGHHSPEKTRQMVDEHCPLPGRRG